MRDVKSGNYAILAQEHTLVLGWNSAAVPVLRQIALAKARVPKPSAFEKCASPSAQITPASTSSPATQLNCSDVRRGGGAASPRTNISPLFVFSAIAA